MAGKRTPGPVCQVERHVWVQDGTMCVAPAPSPGPVGSGSLRAGLTEPGEVSAASATQSISISIGAEMTWEAAVRAVYIRSAEAIREQGQEFVRTGAMTAEEAKVWVNGQRNALINATRNESSPIGRAIAELIKPGNKLKTAAELEELGKTAEGIIESSGKTNPWVNRVTTGFRYGGPALLVVGVSLGGTLAGGWAGGVAGCELFGALGTVVPIVGNAWGCAAGGFVGTIGGAVWGGGVGSSAGDFVYRSLDSSKAPAAAGGAGR
jgi:hypothetical protein